MSRYFQLVNDLLTRSEWTSSAPKDSKVCFGGSDSNHTIFEVVYGRMHIRDPRLNSPFFVRKNERKDGGGEAAGRRRIHDAHAYLNYDLAHQP